MMSEFKVGDRVRVTDGEAADRAYEASVDTGEIGTVTDIDGLDETCPIKVRFGGSHWFMNSRHLEHAHSVFKLQVPPEPAGVNRVRSVTHPDHVYKRNDDGTWSTERGGSIRFTWDQLVSGLKQGLEPVPEESEFERAVRYFDGRDPLSMIRGCEPLTQDDLRRARMYVSAPSLCTVAGCIEWIGALLDELESKDGQ